MITLSRREEQDVLDRAKEQSLKHCEALVKGEFQIIAHYLLVAPT
jgi:hypothetical protein